MSHIHKKIERLEQLISGNNKLVAKLSESLLQRKVVLASGGGRAGAVKVNSSSANSGSSQRELLPGCRLAEEMKSGANGVQVRRFLQACAHAHTHTNAYTLTHTPVSDVVMVVFLLAAGRLQHTAVRQS